MISTAFCWARGSEASRNDRCIQSISPAPPCLTRPPTSPAAAGLFFTNEASSAARTMDISAASAQSCWTSRIWLRRRAKRGRPNRAGSANNWGNSCCTDLNYDDVAEPDSATRYAQSSSDRPQLEPASLLWIASRRKSLSSCERSELGRADAGWVDGIRAVFEDTSVAVAPLRRPNRREEFVDFELEMIALTR